jgi:hypothetical protein
LGKALAEPNNTFKNCGPAYDTGSGSEQAGSGSNQTNTADGSANAAGASAGDTSGITISHSEPIGSNTLPPDDTNVVYPPASLFISDLRASFSSQDDFVKNSLEETPSKDDLDSPEAVRRRILTFLEARQLAGEKWTAQAIAQKLGIPLEIAQIAVLNPIGQNIKVPIPDISELYNGTLVAGDSADTGVFCGNDGLCKVIVGGISLVFGATWDAANNLLDHILQSKSKDVPKDNGDDQNQEKVDPDLKKPARDLIPNRLKRVKDYPSELEDNTKEEILDLAKGKGELAKKAQKLKKLIEQTNRLKDKTKNKGR